MKRILGVLTIAGALAASMALPNAAGNQTGNDRSRSKVKKVQVTAQTFSKLPANGQYVVDLTRKGTIYEFDPTAGPIDFRLVVVRTAAGEQAIQPRLEKALSRKELNEWYSRGFRIGAGADFRNESGVKPPPANPTATRNAFTCDANTCTCSGDADCEALWDSLLCDWIPCTTRGGGLRCICFRHPL